MSFRFLHALSHRLATECDEHCGVCTAGCLPFPVDAIATVGNTTLDTTGFPDSDDISCSKLTYIFYNIAWFSFTAPNTATYEVNND